MKRGDVVLVRFPQPSGGNGDIQGFLQETLNVPVSREHLPAIGRNMEQRLPIAELQTEKARELGDLALIVLDLRAVIDTCDILLAELLKPQPNQVLLESFWTAALIRYIRCFTTGKRLGLTMSILAGLPGDPLGAHRYFKDMRDKHIAHPVNPFEEVKVGVVLSNNDVGATTVEGVATFIRRQLCEGAEGIRTLQTLAREVHQRVVINSKEAELRLLDWAKGQPIETFAVAPFGIITPGPNQARESRK